LVSVDFRVEKWDRWLIGPIQHQVLTMHLHQSVWQRLGQIADANASLPRSYWWTFLSDVYSSSQASAIRRTIDNGKDVISLGRLLGQILEDPGRLTCERHLGLWGHDQLLVSRAQDWWEREFAGDVGTHVDPAIIGSDLDELIAICSPVSVYVDRFVAHTDRRELPADEMPTLKHGTDAIDTVGRLFRRYVLLFRATDATLMPIVPVGWERVFEVPWVSASGTRGRR
jgi:hypothetical protein